ncbi:MAG: endonuclease III [Nitrososphaeria archaeon]
MTVVESEIQRSMLETITKKFYAKREIRPGTQFENLVSIIISQNTNDKNTFKAIALLRKRVGIDPDSILSASKEEIIDCLRPAGLYNVKAPRIIELAKRVKEELGDSQKIEKMNQEEVSKFLSKIRGIGPKTVDVFMAFSKGADIVPVDTHVSRISKRLGITDNRDDYFKIRSKLERLLPAGRRVEAHLAIINFGRKVCIARSPKCPICPVERYCPSKGLFYPLK